MRTKWSTKIGILGARILQAIIVLGILLCIGQIVLGYAPAQDIVDMVALIVLFLLGLGALALNWLIFEWNRIDKE